MGKKLYVGNLPYSATQQTLQDAFGTHGTVATADVIMDRDTGQSKGFGFVEMETEAEAQQAIKELDGTSLDGRSIKVNEAKPRAPRGGGYGGGGGGGRW